jgi:gentisate 1,2-dioxygenase
MEVIQRKSQLEVNHVEVPHLPTDMTSTSTVTVQGEESQRANKADATAILLKTAEKLHTKPLWAQMNRLNPPLPNPKCQPYVWQYEQMRPSLLQAGDLISEKQAERRVLMLVNPSRGRQLFLIQ